MTPRRMGVVRRRLTGTEAISRVKRSLTSRRADLTGFAHPVFSLPAVVYVFIGFGAPIGILVVYSFWPTVGAQVLINHWTLSNYALFFTNSIYWQTLLTSFLITTIAATLSVATSFPFAFFVAMRVPPRRRALWIVAAILPFSVSYLIRVFAWLTLFGQAGILNTTLIDLNIVSTPLGIFNYGVPAMIITFVYLLFPLSFLASYVAIERLDPSILTAAGDLGARPWQNLGRIIVPLAKTGLFAGFALCFISMMGDYVTPSFVGGSSGTLFISFIVTKFGFSAQWGLGSALAFILLAAMLGLLFLLRKAVGPVGSAGEYSRHYVPHKARSLRAYAAVLLAFLYVPIFIVVLFAFNSSGLIGFPISGFTLHWFETVFNDPLLLSALYTSLDVVVWALPFSLALGVLAAVYLARARGRWRAFSIGTLAVPLCLPPVMLGLGIIVGLYALGVTRGFWTIVAAHVLLILPTATFIILVRLEGLDTNLEHAALDLGARPRQVLLRVIAPQAVPGILAAALIGFAVSIDEFLVTYLVTGTTVTLPLYIYSSVRYAMSPELNALSSIMLTASFVLCGIAALILWGWGNLRWTSWRRVLAAPRGTITD